MVKKNKPPKEELAASFTGTGERRIAAGEQLGSEATLSTIFNLVGTGILVIDSETLAILDVNRTAADIIGHPKEKIIGHICHSFICPDEAGKCPIKDLGQNIDISERKIICADGQLKDILKNVSPVIIQGKQCYLESFIDISDRRRVEHSLKTLTARQEAILTSVPDIIVEVDNDKVYTWANQEAYNFFGEDMIGREASFYFEGKQDTYGIVQPVFNGDENPIYLESWQRRKDGQKRLLGWWCRTLKDGSGKIMGALSTAQDITERKRAEEALRESEERYRLQATNSEDVIWTMDLHFRFKYISPSIHKLRGLTPEEAMRESLADTLTPDSLQRVNKMIAARLPELGEGTPLSARLDIEQYRKDGSTVWVEIAVKTITDDDGVITGFVGISREISERKRAEVALRESNEKFGKAFMTSPDSIAITRLADGLCIAINKSFTDLMGYEEREIVGKSIMALNIWANPSDRRKMVELLRANKVVENFEAVFITKTGTRRHGLMSAAIIELNGETHIINTTKDITERIQAREALEESEEKYRLLVENALEAIVIAADGTLKFTNGRATELTGYSRDELTSMPFTDLIHPDERQIVAERHLQRIKGLNVPSPYTFRVVCKSGDIKWVELAAVRITWENKPAILNFLTDITDRKRLEEEQQRVAKLESVGLLAGGIAHDFNNILTSILGNISLARLEAEPGSEIRNSLEQAEKASMQAKNLTQQLLTFSRGGAPVKKLVSLAELLRDSAGFALRGSNVKCNFSIPEDLWHAEIDAGQVSQVIQNLVINAQQAMPAGGNVELAAANMYLSATQSLGRGLPLKAGDYIRVAITDHGIGIPAENLERVFDPFFTTKQKGSGLGLATAFSIARNHGGHVSVESQVGAGSTFYFYLPASSEMSAPEKREIKEIRRPGKARILVMDDEEGVREIAGRMLKRIGYDNIEFATDGTRAVKLYKAAMKSGRPFSAVILDLTIPGGMGGIATIKQLLKLDPGVRAIVSSGYADKSVMAEFKEYGFSGMAAKPYTVEELGKALQDAIG